MTVPLKEYYSPREVSQKTGLAESTVRKYINNGTIPATKLGGRWLIAIAALNTLLER